MSCSNNSKQIGFAVQQYHSVHKQLPILGAGVDSDGTSSVGMDSAGTGSAPPYDNSGPNDNWWTTLSHSNSWRLSAGWTDTFLQTTSSMGTNLKSQHQRFGEPRNRHAPPNSWPAIGPVPSQARNVPWANEIPTLRYLSDPVVGLPTLGRTIYAMCLGDSFVYSIQRAKQFRNRTNPCKRSAWNNGRAIHNRASNRGMFVVHEEMRFPDILDGLTDTIMMGEIATDLGDRNIRTLADKETIEKQLNL